MHTTLFDNVMKSYGDRVKVIYKDYPLFEIHPWAGRAAIDSGVLLSRAQARTGNLRTMSTQIPRPSAATSDRWIINWQRSTDTLDLGKKHSVDVRDSTTA